MSNDTRETTKDLFEITANFGGARHLWSDRNRQWIEESRFDGEGAQYTEDELDGGVLAAAKADAVRSGWNESVVSVSHYTDLLD